MRLFVRPRIKHGAGFEYEQKSYASCQIYFVRVPNIMDNPGWTIPPWVLADMIASSNSPPRRLSENRQPPSSSGRPFLGYGIGLRPDYYEVILAEKPDVDWFEVISENYMVGGGKPLYYLDRIRADYPIVMHGVSLSIGGTDPLDREYLRQLKLLAKRVEPEWISDHLCWTGQGGHNFHDLMPLPYTEEAIKHVVTRVCQVQDYLGCQILLENVSSYLTYCDSSLTEWEFYTAVVEEADCLLLFDINNVYVSAINHGFDPLEYLHYVPIERIRQFHLAGHSDYGHYLIDTHDHPIVQPVWDLYTEALALFGPVSTLIERDDCFPPFSELLAEMNQARRLGEQINEQFTGRSISV